MTWVHVSHQPTSRLHLCGRTSCCHSPQPPQICPTSAPASGSLPWRPQPGASLPHRAAGIAPLPGSGLSSNMSFSMRPSQGALLKINSSPNSLLSYSPVPFFFHIIYHCTVCFTLVFMYLSRNELHGDRNFWSVLLPAPNSAARPQYLSNK